MNVFKYINKYSPKEAASDTATPEDFSNILNAVESKLDELDALKDAQELKELQAEESRANSTLTRIKETIEQAIGREPSGAEIASFMNKIIK